jgi:heme/copper-type cytochrome/quinol oxidase subunit 1
MPQHRAAVAELALLLALLAEWLRDREPRPHGPRLPTLGVLLAFAGAHVFVDALLRMGAQGMPMGYRYYVPQLQAGHLVSALGATLLVMGLVLIVVTVQRTNDARGARGLRMKAPLTTR